MGSAEVNQGTAALKPELPIWTSCQRRHQRSSIMGKNRALDSSANVAQEHKRQRSVYLTAPTERRGAGICFNNAALPLHMTLSPSCGRSAITGGEVSEVTAGCGRSIMVVAWPQLYWRRPELQLILSQGSCHADVFIAKLSRQAGPASRWRWQWIQLPPLHGAQSRLWVEEGDRDEWGGQWRWRRGDAPTSEWHSQLVPRCVFTLSASVCT